ncbi:NAD(P)-binding domain-containing protein [Synergistaceae bacterium OttesenSCG-928-I11]|nr:NAD(P)-binding domain-containing protein [Synergistaceae bacterium OttesenSCG-928-I11]
MKIGFVGSGAIAEILTQKIVDASIAKPKELFAYDKSEKRLAYMQEKYALHACKGAGEVVENAEYVFMCVRSDDAIALAASLASFSFEGKTIITISAGIPMHLYEKNIPGAAVARALPNPPSRIGEGVVALAFNEKVGDAQKRDIRKIFGAMGLCLELGEDKINAVTALTGPGPVYAFFQAIVESSLLLGIDHRTSAQLAFGTVKGCLKMWERDIDDIAGLLTETSTPGGISVRQLLALEQKAFKATVKGCYEEGFQRTKTYSDQISALLKGE